MVTVAMVMLMRVRTVVSSHFQSMGLWRDGFKAR